MHLRRLRPAPAHPAQHATGSSPHLHLHLPVQASGETREDASRWPLRLAAAGLACEVLLVGNLLAMLFR